MTIGEDEGEWDEIAQTIKEEILAKAEHEEDRKKVSKQTHTFIK